MEEPKKKKQLFFFFQKLLSICATISDSLYIYVVNSFFIFWMGYLDTLFCNISQVGSAESYLDVMRNAGISIEIEVL